jgi:hypothetical protein
VDIVAKQKQAGGVKGTFAPGTSSLETEKLMVGTVEEKEVKFKTKVCFSVHEALQAKQLR